MLFINKKTNNVVVVNDDSMIKDYLTNPNFRVAKDADFKETDHPRDEGGKFTSGGGDSGHHDIEPYEKTSGKEETVSLVNKTSGKEIVVTKAAYEKNKESYKSKGFSSSSGKKEANPGKIYITQKNNDKYFNQKLSTKQNGFTYINRGIHPSEDPTGTYEKGDYGYIVVKGKKIHVVRTSENNWEIE